MTALDVIGGAVLLCALGGVAPWISTEAAVVGASLVLPPGLLPSLILACALTQVAAKAGVYAVARWAPDRLPRRARRLVARAEALRGRRGALTALVLSGALVAVPPFYLVTLACGLLRVRFAAFLLAGLTGTTARYAALVWIAGVLRAP